VWIVGLDGRHAVRISNEWLWPRGWSDDGRWVIAQKFRGPTIYRIDARGGRQPESIVTVPFMEAECTPVGPTRPAAFVCAAYSAVADIWMIEQGHREP
jgi:hypothetical protein